MRQPIFSKILIVFAAILILISFAISHKKTASNKSVPIQKAALSSFSNTNSIGHPIVFVSRSIPADGSVYMDALNEPSGSLPGIGNYDRFRVSSPGFLQLRHPDGTIETLIDGANPTSASKMLIDVNSPSVSYDANKIYFSGLPY